MARRMSTSTLLLSGLGTGFLPRAPGTWGSAAAALIWLVAWRFIPGWLLDWATLAAAAVATVGCIALAPRAIRDSGDDDPGWVTIDEFAGQWLAMLGGAMVAGPWIGAAMAFVLFRIFDTTKPWPCRRLENLPAGWGIVADDLMAGLYALLSATAIKVALVLLIQPTTFSPWT